MTIISIVALALCCACCKSKKSITLRRADLAQLTVQHEALDCDIILSDIRTDTCGLTTLTPVRHIKVKDARRDTTQQAVILNDTVRQQVTNTHHPPRPKDAFFASKASQAPSGYPPTPITKHLTPITKHLTPITLLLIAAIIIAITLIILRRWG